MLNNKLLNSSGKLYYNVTYSVGSHGTGSVNPSGKVKIGTKVTITMSPNTYWVANVSASGVSLSGSGNTRTFIMPKNNVSISITFNEAPKYSINCSNCSASPNPAYAGQRVSVYASSPGSNYFFDNLVVQNITTTTSSSYSFNMPSSNISATGNYTKAGTHNVSVTVKLIVEDPNAGTPTVTFNGRNISTSGTTMTLTSGRSYSMSCTAPSQSSMMYISSDWGTQSNNFKGGWSAAGDGGDTAVFYARPGHTSATLDFRAQL